MTQFIIWSNFVENKTNVKTLLCQSVFFLGFILPQLNLSPKTDAVPWNKYDFVSNEKIIFEENQPKVKELLQDTSRIQRSNKTNQGKGNQNKQENSTNNSRNTSGSNSSGQTGGQGNQNNQGNTINNSGNNSGSGSANQTGNQGTAGSSGTTSTNSSTEAFVKSIIWEGVLSKSESMEAGENGSLLAALTPGGEYDISKNWTINFRMKLKQSQSNIFVFETEKAVLFKFNDDLDATLTRMEREGRVIKSETKETANDYGRNLTSSECNLRLVIDCKQNTYRLLGKIEIEGIQIQGKDEMDIKVKPINADIDEDAGGTTGIDEEIEVSGTFKPEGPDKIPTELKGSRDLLKDLPEEFKEFMEDLGGKQTNIIRWKFKRSPFIIKKG